MAPKSFLLVYLLAFTLQIFFSPPVSSSASLLSTSKEISSIKGLFKLGEGCVNKSEDVSVMVGTDALYTATRDGWVKYFILHNETLVNWKHIDSESLYGITTTKDGGVVICDNEKGLIKVTEEGVNFLDPDVRFANDVIEASDGTLYFTVSSTKYKPAESYKDLAEGKPYGQLRKYDPKLKKTTVLHDGFYFANGVALSKDEDFVVVCESWQFRCRRYWLTGFHKGRVRNFVENLPGAPDNINLAPDGSFWIALTKMNQTGVRALQHCRENLELLEAYPGIYPLILGDVGARAVKVDGHDGKITRDFNDPNATYISFVTSALEFNGSLFLASLQSNFIGVLPLHPLDTPKPLLATI